MHIDKYLCGESSEANEYSERDTYTLASNQSIEIEFVRMFIAKEQKR